MVSNHISLFVNYYIKVYCAYLNYIFYIIVQDEQLG